MQAQCRDASQAAVVGFRASKELGSGPGVPEVAYLEAEQLISIVLPEVGFTSCGGPVSSPSLQDFLTCCLLLHEDRQVRRGFVSRDLF